jgi:hypothetical protein
MKQNKPWFTERLKLYASMALATIIAMSCGLESLRTNEEDETPTLAQALLNSSAQPSPKLSPVTDVPQVKPASVSEDADPFSSTIPYYCDPIRYPPNIINNITACKPFLGLPAAYGTGPIGYRIRDDLGYGGRWGHDDDDNHGRRGSWRNRTNRHHNGGFKKYQGSKRPGHH